MASQQRNLKSAEIACIGGSVFGITGAAWIMEHLLQHFHVGGNRLAGIQQNISSIGKRAGERQAARAAHFLDAGNAAQPRQQSVEELDPVEFVFVPPGKGEGHIHG